MAKQHGYRRKPVYYIWTTMKARCLNKNNKSYKDYGERGITVCERWLDFRNFIADAREYLAGDMA